MLRSNKGVDARKVRDIEAEVKDRREYEHARRKLEEKSKTYEQLRKGRTGGLSDAQLDELLFDVCLISLYAYGLHSNYRCCLCVASYRLATTMSLTAMIWTSL